MKKLLPLLALLGGCAGQTPPADEPDVVVPPPVACNATENKTRLMLSLGMFDRLPRIVGGVDATTEQYPFMVAITTPFGFQYCGGSLIAPDVVLTAAHCKVSPGDNVIGGRTKLSDAGGYRVSVKRAVTHADYNPLTNENDASLVFLNDPIPLQPITLGMALQAGTATAIGWGLLHEGDQRTTDTLQQVEVPIVDNVTCKQAYPDLVNDQMCAGEAGKDSCQGDSGGPLVIGAHQVGITSYGIGCARPGLPGVYQRTAPLLLWVKACSGVTAR